MELLEFARGPALTFAIAVFIGGVVFRVVSIFALWRTRDSSANRAHEKPVVIAALREIIRRMWPETVYKQRTLFTAINGYVFHIGLALIVFFLLPHILFFKDLLGLYWPHLPNNVIYAVSMGEDSSRDVPAPVCEKICDFFTVCRGGLEDNSSDGLITDPELVSAVDMYVAGRTAEGNGKEMKKAAAEMLSNVSGVTDLYQVRWVQVNGSERLDVRLKRS
jgi:hypothetical protein